MKLLILGFLSVILLASCKDMQDPVLNGIENVRVNKLALAGSSITLQMKYFNPNRFRAKIKQAEGDAWLDSTYLGHFTVDTLVHVPAKGEFLVPVKLAVDMKYILQNSFSAFLNKQVYIKVTGSAKAGRHGVYKNFPLKYEGNQDLGKLFNQ